jgi:hypothetical protein
MSNEGLPYVYDCMLYKKNCFCGKGDKSNLNIDISKIQINMPLKPLGQMK